MTPPTGLEAAEYPLNVLLSAELKRRGFAAIEAALQHGPVHLIQRNPFESRHTPAASGG